MECFKEHGFFSEGFDPDEIAYDHGGIANDASHMASASHRAGNRKTGSRITTFRDLRYATKSWANLGDFASHRFFTKALKSSHQTRKSSEKIAKNCKKIAKN